MKSLFTNFQCRSGRMFPASVSIYTWYHIYTLTGFLQLLRRTERCRMVYYYRIALR